MSAELPFDYRDERAYRGDPNIVPIYRDAKECVVALSKIDRSYKAHKDQGSVCERVIKELAYHLNREVADERMTENFMFYYILAIGAYLYCPNENEEYLFALRSMLKCKVKLEGIAYCHQLGLVELDFENLPKYWKEWAELYLQLMEKNLDCAIDQVINPEEPAE